MKIKSNRIVPAALPVALYGAFMLLLTAYAGGGAWAADGTVNSVAYGAIPPSATMEVRTFDDSDTNLDLKKVFESALGAAGYSIKEGAALIFNFETRNEIGAWSRTDRRHILSLEADGGRGGGENAKARVNVYNSASGGLFNKGKGGTSIVTPSQYRLEVTVEDRDSGKTIWQGWAKADLHSSDGATLTRKMVPAIVQNIGKTARLKTFPLY